MSGKEGLALLFEEHRSRLQAVAFRMLGSLNEAEDAVQECWLRLGRTEEDKVDSLGAWLTTVVSRVCLDMLRARKRKEVESIDENWQESQAVQETDGNPEQEALLAESVGLALLVVLSRLNPAERVTFVLHDIFAVPFNEIAPIVGKSEPATRQLASRARRRVQGAEPQPEADVAPQRELIDAFLAAARAGDFTALLAALDPDVVFRDDRGPGAIRVARGASALAEQVSGRAKAAQTAFVDNAVGVIAAPRGQLLYVLKFTISQGKIAEVDLISDPLRIQLLDLRVLGNI